LGVRLDFRNILIKKIIKLIAFFVLLTPVYINGDVTNIMEATVPGTESYRERKVARTFVPGSERVGPFRSRERKFLGAKWPRSKRVRERLGQGPIGRFALGSELAREQKGSVPKLANTFI